MSLCAYGDAARPLSLSFERCRFAFAPAQTEFLRGAHVAALALRDVTVEGVDGPLARSWGGVADPVVDGLSGVAADVAPADAPFRTTPI